MKRLSKIGALCDHIFGFFAGTADVVVIFVMIVICIEVVMRYFVGHSLIWVYETTSYAMVFMTFAAAAWILKQEGHTVLDMVINRLDAKSKALSNFITSIFGGLICLVITWYGARAILYLVSADIHEVSAVAPPSYPLYIIIPIGSFLLAIQFFRRAKGYLDKRKNLSAQI